MDVIAVGDESFTLGFELVGIKTFNTQQPEEIKSLAKGQVGVMIIEDKLMGSFDEDQRREFEDSIRPLFVVLSTRHSQESISKLIKRSIGIEL